MQKILLAIIGIVVVVGLVAYFMKRDTTTPTVVPTTPATTTTKPTEIKPSMLVFAETKSGTSTVIASSTLAKPGYIVIYKTDGSKDDKDVKVIGHSAVLGAGEHSNVSITLDEAVKAKDVLVAVLHTDDGNGTFDIVAGDWPVIENNAHVRAVDVVDTPVAAADMSLDAGVETFLKAKEDAMMKAAADAAKAMDDNDVLAVTIHASNYKFSQNTITAKAGQKVRVTFVNDDGLHDFVIDEFAGAKTKQIQGGKTEVIEFTADKKGSFKYYCSVGQHRAMGMEGTLLVQ